VAVWSAVNVAGTRLQDLLPNVGKVDDPENWEQVHVDVIERSAFLFGSVQEFVAHMSYGLCSHDSAGW